jgi:aminoglycoside phosphotransferase (APT) family kinase protein
VSDAGIDPAALLATTDVRDVGDIEPVLVGWGGASVWRVESAEGPYALRVFPAGRADDRDRELTFVRVAFEHGLPVPWRRASGAWEERPWALVQWLPGDMVADVVQRRIWMAGRLGHALGNMQAQLHQVLRPVDGGPAARDWRTWAGPVDDRLLAALEATQPRHDVLIHLDYHPLNVLTERGEISAILDWENARFGDPRADLARTYTVLRFVPVLFANAPFGFERALRRLARSWWAGYHELAGPTRDFAPYVAWAWVMLHADMSPKLGRDGVNLTAEHIALIECHIERGVG